MLRNFDDRLGFEPIHRERKLAGWSPPPPASSRSAVAAVRMMWDAFCEGLAAHREYEALRSRGIAHGRGAAGSARPRLLTAAAGNGHAIMFCRKGMSADRGRSA